MVKEPSAKTLAKYGLDPALFWAMSPGHCHLCGTDLTGKMLFIDHEHVKGFAKMPPEQRRTYVRGILCYGCNRFKVCKNTLNTAIDVAEYLRQYQARRPK